ncbi:hypothetical protein [Deinococcus roseus]|uniref:EthD domain-containing protein n=1 Tax=Deinococcus roseus TaxID=392414 RepID=A0ABQ2DHU8_9DEIO|nr:hypothetical protein [Deinococcus roseus]GGJ55902.1 hypothetical protein GCM10008938_47580 [Deinococcus roseus]
MLKGLALLNRTEPKDAYDVHYVIRHHPEGPEALGEKCQGLLHDPLAVQAYQAIEEKFLHLDSRGPGDVVDFLQGRDPGVDEDFLRLDAQRQVRLWVEGMKK